MKNKLLASALLLMSLLCSQLCMTVHAAEDEIILISPRPTAAENTSTADVDTLLRTQYEKTAGMYAYGGIASQLFDIGVLRGDGVNFNLEQIPDRQQACVMVVRMRGEEAAALAAYEAGEISCPFTDVTDEWVKPYLAWLYEKQITLGIGGGKFGNADCSAQEYVTFMLRALGYTVTWDNTETTDVLYAEVLDFARDIHLWDTCLSMEPVFHRGVMSAVTYQTLAADVKGRDDRLLTVLADAGAVDPTRAQPILDLFDRIDLAAEAEYAAASVIGDGMRMAGTLEHNESLFVSAGDNADEALAAQQSGLSANFGLDLSDGKSALTLYGESTAQRDGTALTLPVGLWLCDGWMYFDVPGLKQKTASAAFDGTPGALTSAAGALSLLLPGTERRYYAITNLYTEVMDHGGAKRTVIAYDTTEFMWPIIAAQLNTEGYSADTALSVVVSTEKYIDENGVLAGVYSGMYAGVGESDAQSGDMSRTETLWETTVTYTAWGDDVSLTFPDFSQFEDNTDVLSVQ